MGWVALGPNSRPNSGGLVWCRGVGIVNKVWIPIGALTVIGGIIALVSVTGKSDGTAGAPAPISATPTAAVAAASASQPPAVQANWSYVRSEDSVTQKVTRSACVTSDESVHQGPPYHDTSARLCVRYEGSQPAAAYIILGDDGQLICGFESCRYPVRFGDSAATNISFADSSDHDSKIKFVDAHRPFIKKVYSSEVVRVQVTLYENGVQNLTFQTKGLLHSLEDWDKAALK